MSISMKKFGMMFVTLETPLISKSIIFLKHSYKKVFHYNCEKSSVDVFNKLILIFFEVKYRSR